MIGLWSAHLASINSACIYESIWKRLAFRSVDWVKQVALTRAGSIMQSAERMIEKKGRGKGTCVYLSWSADLLSSQGTKLIVVALRSVELAWIYTTSLLCLQLRDHTWWRHLSLYNCLTELLLMHLYLDRLTIYLLLALFLCRTQINTISVLDNHLIDTLNPSPTDDTPVHCHQVREDLNDRLWITWSSYLTNYMCQFSWGIVKENFSTPLYLPTV